MAKITLYDAEGNAIEREPVDARECVASGHYSLEAPELTDGDNSGEGDKEDDGDKTPPEKTKKTAGKDQANA